MEDSKIKREARRRKILENSEKRLQKITRCSLEDEDYEEILPEYNTAKHLNIQTANKPVIDESSSTSVDNLIQQNHNKSIKDLRTTIIDEPNHSPSPKQNFLLRTKFWEKLGFKLTMLAIIVRIVHIFELGYLFGETIVIPFSLFMMTQLGSFEYADDVTGIAAPVMFFLGIPPNTIKNLLICYNVFTAMLLYFAMYFCSFVCAHLTIMVFFDL